MSVPKVSIGLPVWNGEKYIRLALDSVLRQDYTDFEFIISDNASTDATQNICLEYAAKDRRIRYFRNEKNIGATKNFNRAFELARGEFFKWITYDDEIGPSFLRRCIETFQNAPAQTVLVCCRSQAIDETGQVLWPRRLEMKSSPKPSCRLASLLSTLDRSTPHPIWGLIRTRTLRQTRLMGVVHADEMLLCELALLGNFVEIPEELQMWRLHHGGTDAVYRTSRQLLAWHDPNKANNRIVLPTWLARDLEYFRFVRHIPLSVTERLICYAIVSWFACLRTIYAFRANIALRTRLNKWFPKLARKLPKRRTTATSRET
jgi:glycosyltransferase involved in cell wall biosynthesis